MADKITAKLKGIPEAMKDIKDYQLFKKEAIRIILKEIALKIETGAKRKVRVKTGHLKGKITHDFSNIKKLSVKVGTNVHYGPAQEFGTKKMKGKPYLFPSYFENENEAIKRIGKVFKKKK